MSLPPPEPHRTAVVTGASSGIGAEFARELARRGHGLVLVARRAERLESLAQELADRGTRIEVLPADLSSAEQRSTLPERVEDLGLQVDVLINNAGLSTVGPVHRADVAAELQMIEVDVVAVAELCTRFVPAMVRRGEGGILNVASTAAFQPLPGQAGYAACKAFVLSYTRALNGELHGTGVSATALCPGPVNTEFADAAGLDDSQTGVLPSFMWEPADAVALAGINALDHGNAVAIPGAVNRATAMLSHMIPKELLVSAMARLHPGMRE